MVQGEKNERENKADVIKCDKTAKSVTSVHMGFTVLVVWLF